MFIDNAKSEIIRSADFFLDSRLSATTRHLIEIECSFDFTAFRRVRRGTVITNTIFYRVRRYYAARNVLSDRRAAVFALHFIETNKDPAV